MTRSAISPSIFLILITFIGISVGISIILKSYGARDKTWELYVATVHVTGGRSDSAARTVEAFLESEAFAMVYAVAPLPAVEIEEMTPELLAPWLEQYLDRQSSTLRKMLAIVVALSASLIAMLGLAQVETMLRIRKTDAAEERAREIAAAEERERDRMGRELHDGLGQVLSLALLQIHTDPNRARETLHGAVGDLRTFTHTLTVRAGEPEELVADLREMVHHHQEVSGVAVRLSCVGMERISPESRRQLFRITQELMSNMARHSRARRASVRIFPQAGKLILRYDDDGIGIPEDAAQRGHGLGNIRRRAEFLGATLRVDGDQGTSIFVSIPMEPTVV